MFLNYRWLIWDKIAVVLNRNDFVGGRFDAQLFNGLFGGQIRIVRD